MGSGLKFPGLVERIEARMRAQGYEQHGRLMWGRWAAEKGYQIALVGGWIKGGTPTYDNLVRLAKDLDVELAWLLLGDPRYAKWDGTERRRPPKRRGPAGTAAPIAGGSAAAEPLPIDETGGELALIRRYGRRRPVERAPAALPRAA